ncbi:MAG: hypothetical protein M1470_14935 [Bacteroidetes bacterium]|nr:hypothetical protein [Bacteroidota bacterium]MCL5737500.1 hypothetical protein [Bacteroidota bacterium]
MDSSQSSSHSKVKVVRWIARVLSGLLILTFSFFFLGEEVFRDSPRKEPLSANGIEQLVLMAVVLISYGFAWKKELLGGSIALLGFIGISIINPRVLSGPIMYLFPLTAILFLLCWWWSKSPRPAEKNVGQTG